MEWRNAKKVAKQRKEEAKNIRVKGVKRLYDEVAFESCLAQGDWSSHVGDISITRRNHSWSNDNGDGCIEGGI